jgi:ABC-type transporter Mla maintaining outer membrane lipid asymmetry ATPase subunit MlaF
MAAWPDVLLFDDPTSGLDPITARAIKDQIIRLRDLEQVTSVLVTHQMPDAFYIAEHRAVPSEGGVQIVRADPAMRAETSFIMLREGRIGFEGSLDDLCRSSDPDIRRFLTGWVPPLIDTADRV